MLSTTSSAVRRAVTSRCHNSRRFFSSNPLASDVGPLATRVHHGMTLALAVLTPVYFAVPDKYTDGAANKTFGVLLSFNIAAHSHIGLNYVATDYVPKISKALLGPARVVILGFSAITLLGMSKMAMGSPGGIKGVVKGVWNPLPEKKKEF
mmetsp:Transcript_36138/g.75170  ORF Transcript_36138/g.75170 Transcript_36138/m.75170 type:complete len:151 (+) Transcript_36138:107-559(+)